MERQRRLAIRDDAGLDHRGILRKESAKCGLLFFIEAVQLNRVAEPCGHHAGKLVYPQHVLKRSDGELAGVRHPQQPAVVVEASLHARKNCL